MRLELVLATAALTGAILVGVAILVWVKRWRQRTREPDSGNEATSFRELYEQGLLEREEYERIRRRLEGSGRPQDDESAGPEAGAGDS